MRQRLLSHLTYANVISTLALFLVLGGGTALAAYVVSSNSQIGPGTVSGHKPPSGEHANIIAGSVNGQDVADNSLTGADILESSLTGDVRKLIYNGTPTGQITPIATVGPYTIKAGCVDVGPDVDVDLFANGSAGTADVMFSQTRNDITDEGNASKSELISANTDELLAAASDSSGNYRRIAGTAMLRTGSTLVQVDFDAVADGRSAGSCFIYGTATKTT
jgi:hypothetical protein